MKQSYIDIANMLTTKGKLLEFKSDSVLNNLEVFNSKEELSAAVNTISNKVSYELTLIKNKLLPLMQELTNVINKNIDNMEDISEIAKYHIEYIEVPEYILELKNSGKLKPKRLPMAFGKHGITLPAAESVDVVKRYMTPKDPTLIPYIENIISKYKEEELCNIWDKYLTNLSNSNIKLKDIFKQPNLYIDEVILLSIMLNNLRVDKYKTLNIEADELYYTVIPVISDEINNLLSIVHDNILEDTKNGRIIINKDEYSITVIKELVDKLLGEGGSVDSIYGAIISNIKLTDYYYTSFKGIATELADKWINKVKYEGYNSIPITISRYKAIYAIAMKTIYDAYLPNDLKEILQIEYNKAVNILDTKLKSMNNDKILDYNYMSRYIIGEVMFSNTNFMHFTNTMLGYMDFNKTFTQQDAATFASLDMIIDYLLLQIDFSKI